MVYPLGSAHFFPDRGKDWTILAKAESLVNKNQEKFPVDQISGDSVMTTVAVGSKGLVRIAREKRKG